jgi:hypothetical protein
MAESEVRRLDRHAYPPPPDQATTMSLFQINGTVTAIGQSVFDNVVTLYAYLEITEDSGQRVSIENVAVCSDVGARLRMGVSGEFFVDRISRNSGIRCQLWAIKADGVAVLDSRDLRKRIATLQLMWGLVLTPFGGAGLFLVVPALFRLAASGSEDRRRMFYGTDPAETLRLERQQPVRI